MNILFPHFTTFFTCDCTLQEAMQKISETVECKQNALKILSVYNNGTQNIALKACSKGYILYYNSFLPMIQMQIREYEYRSQISISFELKRSTKALYIVFFVILMLCEAYLLFYLAMNRANLSVQMLIPLAMMAFFFVLSTLGLYFSSKSVLKVLYFALTSNNQNTYPPLSIAF